GSKTLGKLLKEEAQDLHQVRLSAPPYSHRNKVEDLKLKQVVKLINLAVAAEDVFNCILN
ncbi:unnamed protein product, partial [Clavelina lepadiformis]